MAVFFSCGRTLDLWLDVTSGGTPLAAIFHAVKMKKAADKKVPLAQGTK